MTVSAGGILMFFMALVSAYIVRKDIPNSSWVPLQVPRILWLNTADSDRQQLHPSACTQPLRCKGRRRISSLVGHHHAAWNSFRRRTDSRVAAARRAGNFSGHQSEQQLLLRFHRRARFALAGRSAGAALRAIPRHAKSFKGHRDRSRLDVLAFYGWSVGLLVSTFPSGTVKRE